MNSAAVLGQLSDLPQTFRPQGSPYAQLLGSLANGESLFANGADGMCAQALSLAGAADGWIDAWGLLFGVPRSSGEGNVPYAARIAQTVLAFVGTLPAIQVWLNLFAPGGSVTELSPGPGYALSLPATMFVTQVAAFVASLGRIRPAGVPFTVSRKGAGMYLGTETFLGAGGALGSYSTAGMSSQAGPLSATTPSAQPMVPDLFLVDPNLGQPGLLALGTQGSWPPVV